MSDCHKHRAVIDIGDIDISIKISCDIDIDTEIVDIDILELGVTPVLDLSSLTINIFKKHFKIILRPCKLINLKKLVWLMCLVALSSLAFMSLQFRFFGSGKHSFIELLMNYFLWSFSLDYD